MKKFISTFLALVICLSLIPAALAEGRTEMQTGLGEKGDMTFTVYDVIDVRTVMLSVKDYDYDGNEIVTSMTIPLIQIPYTGARIVLSVDDGSTSEAFPGGWEAYRLEGDVYGFNPDGENFYGQMGYACAGDPWDDTLNFSESGLLETDILGILLDGDHIAYFTCGDLDEIIAAAGVEVESSSDPENPFQDVFIDAYYYDAVIWAAKNNITNGVTPTTFGPNETCTRAQVVTFLWRACGSPEVIGAENPFTDVKEGDYFYHAVLWAVEKGITNGVTATTFGPSVTCSSAHVITFLWRANGCPVTEHKTTSVPEGMYYTDAVSWGESKDFFYFLPNPFVPDANSPRAEIVTYLYLNSKG